MSGLFPKESELMTRSMRKIDVTAPAPFVVAKKAAPKVGSNDAVYEPMLSVAEL
jgi:hypothetical protein